VARSASECLDDELVMELIQGRLADAQLLAAEEHMTACADCRMVVAEASAADRTSELTGPTRRVEVAGASSIDPAGPSLAPGTRVSRYVIQELIGVGAIGAVYAARDPELHRMVALKVLRTGAAIGAPAGDLRARLLREARAMAQLSHPNVVVVHDAGTHQDGVFLAMELVAGTTLRRWLGEERRSLDEIVGVFRAAGEGLAAAHRSGLVHRDFKPENVLVGIDGRVRVTDFGLARPTGDELTGSHRAIGGGWMQTVVTRTGIVAGTPAYMSPEQFTGESPDPRSDQFSFCVALYEAVVGERPFTGSTLDEVADAIVHGRLASPPPGVTLPPGLRAAVLRGLRVRREDRHPSMEALLGALVVEAPVAGRRRWLPVAMAAAGAAAFAVTLIVARGGDEPEEEPVTAEPAPPMREPAAPTPTAIAPQPQPAEPQPVPDEVPAESAHRASARRPRSRPPVRRETDQAPPPPPVRVGDGLRDPFGGSGAH
jgi:serine/threonine protein kinase